MDNLTPKKSRSIKWRIPEQEDSFSYWMKRLLSADA